MAGTNIPELATGYKWPTLQVSYSFLIDWPTYFNQTQQDTFGPRVDFTDVQKEVVRSIFQYIQTLRTSRSPK